MVHSQETKDKISTSLKIAYMNGRTRRNSKGKNNPRWKGGVALMGDRYSVYVEGSKTKNNRMWRARKVMQDFLGRPLKSNEIVHHINQDTTDDRIENLQLMTWGEHSKHHIDNQTIKRCSKTGKFIKKGE